MDAPSDSITARVRAKGTVPPVRGPPPSTSAAATSAAVFGDRRLIRASGVGPGGGAPSAPSPPLSSSRRPRPWRACGRLPAALHAGFPPGGSLRPASRWLWPSSAWWEARARSTTSTANSRRETATATTKPGATPRPTCVTTQGGRPGGRRDGAALTPRPCTQRRGTDTTPATGLGRRRLLL